MQRFSLVVAALALGTAALIWSQLPDIRRYLKMRSM